VVPSLAATWTASLVLNGAGQFTLVGVQTLVAAATWFPRDPEAKENIFVGR
jgi:hypothetical protein